MTGAGEGGGIIAAFGRDRFWSSLEARQWGLTRGALDDDALRHILDLDTLDRLVVSGGLVSPDLQLVANGRAHDLRMTESIAPAADVELLFDSYCHGASFRVQHLENYVAGVKEYCRRTEEDCGAPVRANTYVSPPGSKGLAPHYDLSDALIVQIHGAKTWRVYEHYTNEAVLPLPTQRFNARVHTALGEPETFELEKGDILFLPKGVMHAAATSGSPSVHVTFSLLSHTVADLLSLMIHREALKDSRLRQPVLLADLDGVEALVRDALAALDIGESFREAAADLDQRMKRHKPRLAPGVLRDRLTSDA